MIKSILALGALLLAGASASAQIPLDYYSGLYGLTGRDLKQALHELTSSGVSMLTYGGTGSTASSIKIGTWWGFYVTDRTPDGKVRDRYSDRQFSFGERSYAVDGMNIEHSFPKSWWGGAENNAYKDLFNLMPSEKSINQSKSNYPMGPVDRVGTTNGVTKIGWQTGDSGTDKYWEPADKWKGDFARGYLYMATAYQNLAWSGDQSVRILEKNAYPTLQQWAYSLYLDWAEADPVDDIETVRNNDVEKFQGNRNPFVDFPNLAHYVWGDSVGVPFNPLTSVKSQSFTGGKSAGYAKSDFKEIYANSFLGDEGGCKFTYADGSASGIRVWYNDAKYGWKGSGSRGSSSNLTCYNTNSTLWLPQIDLTNYKTALLEFDHAVNFCSSPAAALSLVCEEVDGANSSAPRSGAQMGLEPRVWPLGVNWNFLSGGPIDLTALCGKTVKIGFNYTSNTSEAATWELKNLKIKGIPGQSGVEFIEQDMLDPEDSMPEEYYTIDGRRIPSLDGVRGLVIVRRGSHASKIYIP